MQLQFVKIDLDLKSSKEMSLSGKTTSKHVGGRIVKLHLNHERSLISDPGLLYPDLLYLLRTWVAYKVSLSVKQA